MSLSSYFANYSWPTVQIEFLGEINLYFGLGIEILTALLLGSLIGYDREKKLKSAGIKTNVLICLGATLYTAVSKLNLMGYSMTVDPNRLSAQIVSGIGFLGAGAIIQSRGNVKGLTTAATIWVVAAIGVTIGIGFPVIATIFTLTMLSVLNLLGPVYRFFSSRQKHRHYHFEILSQGSVFNRVRDLLNDELEAIYDMTDEPVEGSKGKRITFVSLSGHPHKIEYLSKELKKLIRVQEINFISVSKDLVQNNGNHSEENAEEKS
ncbi:MgtC/SapB family protein [Bacteriovoracaceae bacterium]|nr:MgtC/SapB family protein [Bacteriovoracaceae bacterium]